MKEWGLANVHLESWPFGRGWQNQSFVGDGGDAARLPAHRLSRRRGRRAPTARSPAKRSSPSSTRRRTSTTFKGKLRGKFVLATPMREVAAHFEAPGHRYTDAELADLSKQPEATGRGGRGGRGSPAAQEFQTKKTQFWIDEGVAALLDISRGDGGTLFVQGGGSRDPEGSAARRRRSSSPSSTTAESSARSRRTSRSRCRWTSTTSSTTTDLNAFNIVAELPGTDKADEVVMLGAHFDSWHTGTGATDNAAGSAIMMEAMRILKTTGVKLRRTVRIGLWGGEEQGLLGSKEYVKAHFGDPATMQLKPEHAKFAGYFNVDNGTGLIRGVYLQGNEAVAPIFQAWMEPFKNLGMTTLTIRNTGGTDHLSYDAVGSAGLPVHPGRRRIRLANAPLEHGRLRAHPGERHDAERGHRRVVRVQHGEPRREAAAQAAAESRRLRLAEAPRSRRAGIEIGIGRDRRIRDRFEVRRLPTTDSSPSSLDRIFHSTRAAGLFARAPRGLHPACRPATAAGTSSCRRRPSPAR